MSLLQRTYIPGFIIGSLLLMPTQYCLAQNNIETNLEDFNVGESGFGSEGVSNSQNTKTPNGSDANSVLNFQQEADDDAELDLGEIDIPENKAEQQQVEQKQVEQNKVEPTPIEPTPVEKPVPTAPTVQSTAESPADVDEPAPTVAPSQNDGVDPRSTTLFVTDNDFEGTPYIPGGRRTMAAGEAPEYYKVEPGDTLFDICDQLIDEADYWPKLWALNPGIKNPHFIFPNMTLSFYPGDDTNPPYLQVVAEEDIIPLETGGLTEEDFIAQPIDSISDAPSGDEFTQVNNVIFDHRKLSYDLANEFESIGEIFEPNAANTEIPAFIFEDTPDVYGEVLAGPHGQFQIAEGGDAIIEDDDNKTQIGSFYTVLRPAGDVDDVNNDTVGERFDVVGHIVIKGTTGDEDAKIAKVLDSRLGMLPGDLVVPYLSTKRSFDRSAEGGFSESAELSIVGFEYASQRMGGQNQLVFVSGQHSPGTMFPVYQETEFRLPQLLDTNAPNMSSRVAFLKIIDKVGVASLGIILRNTLDVRLGDRLGRNVSP